MKDGKKHGLFWVFKTILTFLLIIYTCVRCCMIVSDKHHASALTGDSVTLTESQTVALYGTTFNCLIRLDDSYSTQTPIQFTLYDTTDNYGYLADGGGFSYSGTAPQSDNQSYNDTVNQYCRNAKYLIYRADPYQWGNIANYGLGEYRFNGDYDFLQNMISQGAGRAVECHIPFSITLSDISEFKSAVFYSTFVNQAPYFQVSWYTYNRITYLTDIANFYDSSIPGFTINGIRCPWTPLMPIYGYDGQTTLDETKTATFSGFYSDIYEDGFEPFSLSGFTIDAYIVSSINPVYGDFDIWLLVACPTITGYEPPVVTTTRPAETIPAATYPVETMPPSFTDTPQNILNQNLITNNYQLNLIIGQLNLIYNQLKLNGELNARLAAALDADNVPGLQFPENTNIRQYMSEVFYQSGTDFVYSPEDLQSYTRAIPWLSSMLHGQTWFIPFAFLGTIGLIMIVFSYLVFRR